MKHPQIISLSAPRPQSGKDTLAAQLVEHFGKDRVATIAFGDYLRSCVSHLFSHESAPLVWEMLNSPLKDVVTEHCMGTNIVHSDYRNFLLSRGINLHQYQTPRFHMQMFGNDYIKGEAGLEDFWVDVVSRRIEWLKRSMPSLKYIIVTDTRSPNEFEWLGKQGAEFVMVKRTGFAEDQHDDTTKRHPVETHADKWEYDLTIWNQYGHPDAMLDQFLTFNNL